MPAKIRKTSDGKADDGADNQEETDHEGFNSCVDVDPSTREKREKEQKESANKLIEILKGPIRAKAEKDLKAKVEGKTAKVEGETIANETLATQQGS